MAVAHLALDLRLGDQGGDRVQHDHVNGPGPDQGVHDLQGLLARGGLGDQQLVDVDAQVAGVLGVDRVLGVHEGGHAALLLGLGDHVVGDGRLARRLGPVDLRNAPARDAPHAEREVQGQRAGRDRLDLLVGPLAQPHDGAGAELLGELRYGHVECFVFVQWFLLECLREFSVRVMSACPQRGTCVRYCTSLWPRLRGPPAAMFP